MKNEKLRYYMRGLGIGILVTTVIMGVAGKDTEPMTDIQIRERAVELGMVDSNALVLSELQKSEEESSEEPTEPVESETEPDAEMKVEDTTESERQTATETENETKTQSDAVVTETQDETEHTDETEMQDKTETADETGLQDEVETQDEAETSYETKPQDETETKAETESQIETESQNTDTVSITVKAGASSDTVSKDLAAVGLVADAKAFDTYLCDNGYAQSIRVGTYEITPGTSEEEIAKIITGKK